MRKTSDYGAMRSLALRAGLEDGNFDGNDASFGYFVDHNLVGCAALKVKEGLFTVECLAVSEEYRGRGLGQSLIRMIEAEAVARGASQIWALARAAGFFIRNGYRQMAEESPEAHIKIKFKKGDNVRIKEGPFENFEGTVDEVIPAKGMIKVTTIVFNRPTSVELGYWQVEAV